MPRNRLPFIILTESDQNLERILQGQRHFIAFRHERNLGFELFCLGRVYNSIELLITPIGLIYLKQISAPKAFGKIFLGIDFFCSFLRKVSTMQDLNEFLEPGMLVKHPSETDWGVGQVQSRVNGKVTVNFTEVGKIVIDGYKVALVQVISQG